MKKRMTLLLAVLLLAVLPCACALADTAPVNWKEPQRMDTQAEGELETYGLTFPEEMPLEARNFVLLARAQFEKHNWAKLPKNNEYTKWYYRDNREIGWCSVFQIWCAYHSGLQLVKYKQDVTVAEGDVISAMEGRVGNVYYAFDQHGRWLQCDQVEAVPRPGYLVIYGVRASTPYTHVAIVESVKELGDGVYELTTIEGNINTSVRRMNYRYDATPARKYYNMSRIPDAEITEENCQYKLQKDNWYITGFCRTW